MSALSIVAIGFGVLVIVLRGPLVFAPQRTVDAYRRMVDTVPRIRVFGLCFGVLGAVMALLARGVPQTEARILYVVGWILVCLACFSLLLIPRAFRRLALAMLDAVSETVLRAIGVLGTAVGVLLIYLGLAVR